MTRSNDLLTKDEWMSRVVLDRNTGCWLWQKQIMYHGYGRTKLGGRPVLAHVAFYTLFKGAKPTGTTLDHLCRTRRCCNPAHLEAVSHVENCRRSVHATKTHCRHGHSYADGVETYERRDKHGKQYRRCLTCYRAKYKGTAK
jgi:hypothetical protein